MELSRNPKHQIKKTKCMNDKHFLSIDISRRAFTLHWICGSYVRTSDVAVPFP